MSRLPFVVLVLLVTPFLAGCVDQDAPGGDGTPSPSPTTSPTTSATPSPTVSDSPTPTQTPSQSPDPSPSDSPTPTPEGETHTVQIGANVMGPAADYDPDPITIQVGDSIVWENVDTTAPHTATENGGDGFDTQTLASGDSSEAIRFDTAGTYTYYCKVHPSTMSGARVVVEA